MSWRRQLIVQRAINNSDKDARIAELERALAAANEALSQPPASLVQQNQKLQADVKRARAEAFEEALSAIDDARNRPSGPSVSYADDFGSGITFAEDAVRERAALDATTQGGG